MRKIIAESRSAFISGKALLLDHAAGDPVAGIAGRLRFVIVRLRVDHQRSSFIGEKRIRTFAQRDTRITHRCLRSSVLKNSEVGHVAGVRTLRVLQAVLFVTGIEVWARRSERRRIAYRVLMDVDGVAPGRQVLPIEFDRNSIRLAAAGDRRLAYALTL